MPAHEGRLRSEILRPSLFRRFIGSIALLVSVLAALWLMLCTAASFVSPLQVKYLALFSITAPFAIVANVALLFAWLFFAHRKWRVVVPLLALGFSYRIIIAVFGFHPFVKSESAPSPDQIKVMSWNVHGMGIFDRTPAGAGADEKIMARIVDEKPDILCLAEFYTTYNNVLKPYSTAILKRNGFKEFRFQYDNTLGTKVYLGTGIFCRYPITDFKMNALHTRSDGQVDVVLLQYDVTLPTGRTIRVFFTHLQSFLLSDKEKTYLEEVKHQNEEIGKGRAKSFMRRFGEAYVKRAIQAERAAEIIAQSPYPALICGDFNDLPGSYTYEQMRAGKLKDAFSEGGFGLGRSYNLFSSTLRIDYILYDPAALRITGMKTVKTNLSDHNPVIATFKVRPE